MKIINGLDVNIFLKTITERITIHLKYVECNEKHPLITRCNVINEYFK